MLDSKITKPGTILIHEGSIYIDNFDTEGRPTMCRELCILAMIWAIGELQKSVAECIAAPGGGNSCADLPDDVRIALGIPSTFERDLEED